MTQIAPDTNLLITVTPRRWITLLQEARRSGTVVTPTVARQVERNMGKLTERYLRSQFARHEPKDRETEKAAILAAKEADVEWWLDEQERNDSTYEFVVLSRKEQSEVRRERTRLPAGAFSDRNQEDLDIVAEAIVIGVPLVVSHNFQSITIDRIREEAEQGFCATIDIRKPRDAFEELCGRDGVDPNRMLLGTLAATAAHPDSDESVEEQTRRYIQAWRRFEDGLVDEEQLADLGSLVYQSASIEEWKRAKEIARRFSKSRARETENRYHTRRRRRIEAAGYDPWEDVH